MRRNAGSGLRTRPKSSFCCQSSGPRKGCKAARTAQVPVRGTAKKMNRWRCETIIGLS